MGESPGRLSPMRTGRDRRGDRGRSPEVHRLEAYGAVPHALEEGVLGRLRRCAVEPPSVGLLEAGTEGRGSREGRASLGVEERPRGAEGVACRRHRNFFVL